ncbi:MAG: shikimate dehydrogenase [Candidatus Omnitrophica bacterium]|nr:shikimate dehydrogenase [Candidatus Omnitrophota bacterium]
MTYEPPAIYGIIGHPLTHSLSPLMHNAAFKSLQVNAVYKLFPLGGDQELKLFMEDLREEGNPIFGLNVTVPYKEKILPFLDAVDPFAAKAGAVNTIVITHQRKMRGFNTDGPGFLSHLSELGFDPKGKRIAILGAGGTARAILSVLCLINDRPAGIKLYNRTVDHAQKLAAQLGQNMDASLVEVVHSPEDLNVELADCLINTTSVGLKGEDKLLIDPDAVHPDMLVYDVIYNPPQTALLKAAKSKGAQISNGLGMLYYQGILAFKHWAGVDIDGKCKAIMRKALQEGLKNES